MKELTNIYFSLIFKVSLVIVLTSSLFLFANLTTDLYETPKFLLLLIFTGVMLILLTIKYTIQNKVVFIRTPLDIPLLLILVVAIISTFLSSSSYVSALGNQARVFGSLASWATLVVFYFLLTNNLRSHKDIRFIFYISLFLGGVLSVLSLLSYFGIKYLPAPLAQGQNFTPTGLSFSTAAILALLLPIPLLEILGDKGDRGNWVDLGLRKITNFIGLMTSKLVNSLLLALFGVTIALTGDLASIVGAILALALALLITKPSYKNLNLVFVVIPVALVVLVAALSLVPPIGGAKNPLYDLSHSYPREIQLDFISSWKVSVSSFRDHPIWGTGPATFLFNFTNYKPIEFNSSKYWNIRFDTAFNEYLQALGTLGGLGLLGLLSLSAMFISSAWKTLARHYYRHPALDDSLSVALAISGITFFVILAFHAGTLPIWIVGLLVLAALMVLNLTYAAPPPNLPTSDSSVKQVLLKIASVTTNQQSSEETIRIEALPGVLLIISLGITLFSFFLAGKFALADYHHRLALNAIAKNDGLTAYNGLVEAEKLNALSDLYRTDLAQVNFALANAIALSKGPTAEAPAGSLTDQDKQNIQVLLQQSINEGRTAVALNPRSAINWEILATLYRQIAGVAENALLFSLDSYGRAIFQDPLNPNLRLSVGGTYYAIKNYDLAIRFFTDAINLKPDFANGYYNLSVALRDKGDLNAALQAGEKLLQIVDASSDDYKVATNYVDDLKNRISPPTPPQPPAAETSGALQEDKLPKVVNVGQPPAKIATPSAVKKPGATPEPSPTP